MGVIDWWKQITDMEKIPFLNEHWYLVLLPCLLPLIVTWVGKSGRKSNYIHVTSDNATCSTCYYYHSWNGHCEKHNCGINSPGVKTCDHYREE